ncbi:MAG: hypothetical protein WC364_01085 [Eubacteriales bacterium]|jgi:hypothetical protein
MERKFSKAEALKFGWEALKKNISVFLVISLIYCLINYLYELSAPVIEVPNTTPAEVTDTTLAE